MPEASRRARLAIRSFSGQYPGIAKNPEFPAHEDLVDDLKVLREKGLRQLRVLRLPAFELALGYYEARTAIDPPAAVEALLRESVDRLGGGPDGRSAQLSFGLTEGTRSASPRIRRELAAEQHGRTADTFRKRYEPGLFGDIATLILEILIEQQERRLFPPAGTGRAVEERHGDASPLNDAVFEKSIQRLTAEFVPGQGFPSQRYGETSFSLASTGCCASVIFSNNTGETTRRMIATFISESIQPDGTLPTHSHNGETIKTTWAASQSVMALATSPAHADLAKAVGLSRWLLDQQSDEGWKLRDRDGDHFEPVFSVYPVLALIRATRAGWITASDLRVALMRLKPSVVVVAGDSSQHPARQLIAEYLSDVIAQTLGRRELPTVLRDQARSVARAAQLAEPDTYQQLGSYTVIARDQPLWYVRLWRPALYLMARRVYPAPSPITVLLGAELLDTYSPQSSGWSPHEPPAQHATAFTWTTALGLQATAALRDDLGRAGYTESAWQRLAAVTRRAAWE